MPILGQLYAKRPFRACNNFLSIGWIAFKECTKNAILAGQGFPKAFLTLMFGDEFEAASDIFTGSKLASLNEVIFAWQNTTNSQIFRTARS